MADQNNSVPLNKFKRFANKALRMEREKSHLDLPNLNKASDTNPQVEPISIEVSEIKQSPTRPCSQPPSTRSDTSITDSGKMLNTQENIQLEAKTLLSCNLDDNMDENAIFGRLQASQARTLRSEDDHVDLQRTLDDRVHPHRTLDNRVHPHRTLDNRVHPHRTLDDRIHPHRTLDDRIHPHRTLDDHIFSRHPKHDHVYQCRSKDDEILHRHQVKKAHEHSPHPIRVARAAGAAAASTVIAQLRKDAIAAVARQHAPYIRMAAVSSANSAQSDKRRVMRNSNLLSSALSIIREMDPAFLEMLCYAIHDQVTQDDPSESD